MDPKVNSSLGTLPRYSGNHNDSATGLGKTFKCAQNAPESHFEKTPFKPISSNSNPAKPNDTHSFKQESSEAGRSAVENSVNPTAPHQDPKANNLDECINFLSLPYHKQEQVPHPFHSENPQEIKKSLQKFWDYARTSKGKGGRPHLSYFSELIGAENRGPKTPDIVNDDAKTFIRKAQGTKERQGRLLRAGDGWACGRSFIDATLELALREKNRPATFKILEGLQLVKNSDELNPKVLATQYGTLLKRDIFQKAPYQWCKLFLASGLFDHCRSPGDTSLYDAVGKTHNEHRGSVQALLEHGANYRVPRLNIISQCLRRFTSYNTPPAKRDSKY